MSKLDERLQRAAPPRVGPFREHAFESPLHQTRVAAWLGVVLGVSFLICFLTGFLSHLIQHPPGWLDWPPRPAWLFRVTQGIHVITGIASIPLLLAKLWTVYPRFWAWPPLKSAAQLVERISLLPLVGGSLFMLFSGVASIARWYPWGFSFPPAHYAVAWITIGALVVHVSAKIGATRLALSSRSPDLTLGVEAETVGWGGLSRRGFLGAVTAGSAVLVATIVGQTLRPLAPLAILAPRDPRIGPQGVPVNKTAGSAGVTDEAMAADYRLKVSGNVQRPMALALSDLRAMPQHDAHLAIACVDGWSSAATWGGVSIRDLLARVGAPEGSRVSIQSLQHPGAAYSGSELDPAQAADPDTMLALTLNGESLDIDHGYPVRLIGPNRPGVQQTKWVGEVTVL